MSTLCGMWRIWFVSSSAWIDEKVHGPFMERIWLPERTAATLTRMFRYGQSVFDVLGRKPVSRRHCNGTDLNNHWPRSVAAFFLSLPPCPSAVLRLGYYLPPVITCRKRMEVRSLPVFLLSIFFFFSWRVFPAACNWMCFPIETFPAGLFFILFLFLFFFLDSIRVWWPCVCVGQ